MHFEEVSKKHKDIDEIKRLYLSAFPVYERMPFWFMLSRTRADGVKLLGVYDGGSLIGMVYLMAWRDIIYILYFAVAENKRGSGYGSGILAALKDKYKDCRFILEIEEVSLSAKNYEERRKRKAFYEKNGFHDPGLLLSEAGVRYYFMTVGSFDIKEYSEMIKVFRGALLSLLSKPKITKRG